MAAGGSTRAIVAALLANLGIAIAKFVGFVLTRASSRGPEQLLVAGKVQFGRGPAFHDVVHAIDAAEQRVRAAVPIARVIYLEPARAGDDANVGGLSATADGAGPQPQRDVPASEADRHG